MNLNVSMNIKLHKFLREPRQFELLHFRVAGEMGLHKSIAEARQSEFLMDPQNPDSLNFQTLGGNDNTYSRGNLYYAVWEVCAFRVPQPMGKEKGNM